MDSNKRVVLLGLENPDGSLNGSLQVIETLEGLSVSPEGDEIERNVVRSTLSNAGSVIGAKNYQISLPVELKGAGLDGASVKTPEMSAAFQACGMVLTAAAMITVTSSGGFTPGETLTNTTATNPVGTLAHAVDNGNGTHALWVWDLKNMPSATDAIAGDTSTKTGTVTVAADALCYSLTSDRQQHKTCQIHTYMDGVRRIGRKGRASFSLDWMAGKESSVQFSIKTLYETPADESLPAANYSDVMPPFGESAGLAVSGFPADGTIEKLAFNLGNDIVPIPDINSPDGRHSYRISIRKPTGSIDPEVTQLADFNPFTLWENGSKSAIHATLGKTAGEYVSVVIPAAQFTGIKDKQRAGMDAYDLNYNATGKNDDEFYLFFH